MHNSSVNFLFYLNNITSAYQLLITIQYCIINRNKNPVVCLQFIRIVSKSLSRFVWISCLNLSQEKKRKSFFSFVFFFVKYFGSPRFWAKYRTVPYNLLTKRHRYFPHSVARSFKRSLRFILLPIRDQTRATAKLRHDSVTTKNMEGIHISIHAMHTCKVVARD